MKHTIRRFFALALALILSTSAVLPAAAAEIDLGVTVTPGTDSITVTVDDSTDTNAVLAATPGKLKIACDFDNAEVIFDSKPLSGAVLDAANDTITFPVGKGGSYTIRKVAPYTVTFNSNGGSSVTELTAVLGDPIAKPTDPTRTDYTFDGWYTDDELTTQWDFEEDTVTASMTLYAKWTKIITKTGSADVSAAGDWDPAVDSATLDAAAKAQGTSTQDAELLLTIKDQDEDDVLKTDREAIEKLAIGRDLEYLDMTLECSIDDGDSENIGDDNNVLIKITLDFDFTGKNNVMVFRYHDKTAEIIPERTDETLERAVFDKTSKTITLYVKKFSTYAVGYTEGSDELKDYEFSKGHGSKWAKDSSRNLVFICKAPIGLLTKATINGSSLPENAVVESHEDGIKITLKPAFLKTLPRGKYYLELEFENGGYAVASFLVTRASGNSSTRDLFNMALWVSLLGLSAAGVVVLVILKKRKK